MLWTKIKISTALVLALGALSIGGAITHQTLASSTGAAADPPVFASHSFAADPTLAFQDEPKERGKEERGQEIPQVRGQIKEVDAAKGTITLVLAAGRGDRQQLTKTYNLANKDIKVAPTFGPRAKLADLKAGLLVTARLSRSEEHTTELQSHLDLVCSHLLVKNISLSLV